LTKPSTLPLQNN